MSDHFTIRLGEHEWLPYTYPRTVADGLKLLGSVRRGMQRGALAVLPDGQYVAVVGDHQTPLNRGQIQRVLEAMRPRRNAVRYLYPDRRPASSPPTVFVKRRRVPQYG